MEALTIALTVIAAILVVGGLVVWIVIHAIDQEIRRDKQRRSHPDSAFGQNEETSATPVSTAIPVDSGSSGDAGGGGD